MFKKGDEVVAIKRIDYEVTKTAARFDYVEKMQIIADAQVKMIVREIRHDGNVLAEIWKWCPEDLELVAEEEN